MHRRPHLKLYSKTIKLELIKKTGEKKVYYETLTKPHHSNHFFSLQASLDGMKIDIFIKGEKRFCGFFNAFWLLLRGESENTFGDLVKELEVLMEDKTKDVPSEEFSGMAMSWFVRI
jgi:diacylglycerol kinase family enzyme